MADDLTREWRERLERWTRSGSSGHEFAGEEGVSPSSLYRWSRRLDVGPRRSRGRPRKTIHPGLLPVIVTPAAAAVAAASPVLEVALRGGEVVRVAPGFDEETLLRVVRALGGAR